MLGETVKAWKVFLETGDILQSAFVGSPGKVYYPRHATWRRDSSTQGPAACFRTKERAKQFKARMQGGLPLASVSRFVMLPVRISLSRENLLWYKCCGQTYRAYEWPKGTVFADSVTVP